MNKEAVEMCGGALRVIPAETRLTVYRRRPVFLGSKIQNGEAKEIVKTRIMMHDQTRACKLSYRNDGKYRF